jgi:hypothetical protein
MRTAHLAPWALVSLAAGHAIERRASEALAARGDQPWHPLTKSPAFFNLKVNDRCDEYTTPPITNCPMEGYGIRLAGGNVMATPYDRWWDPTLATFFVDDDTTMYTVS